MYSLVAYYDRLHNSHLSFQRLPGKSRLNELQQNSIISKIKQNKNKLSLYIDA